MHWKGPVAHTIMSLFFGSFGDLVVLQFMLGWGISVLVWNLGRFGKRGGLEPLLDVSEPIKGGCQVEEGRQSCSASTDREKGTHCAAPFKQAQAAGMKAPDTPGPCCWLIVSVASLATIPIHRWAQFFAGSLLGRQAAYADVVKLHTGMAALPRLGADVANVAHFAVGAGLDWVCTLT